MGGPTLRFQCLIVPFDLVEFPFQVLNPHISFLDVVDIFFSFAQQLFVQSFHIVIELLLSS
ncbi:unnamed protein product [Tuber melanosporum]|uniref:(Perigord truffle) hypothetical protein n=1 Tax=Tuber melanosporum (strain Mel28) TaxID=656061 RepID=D5G935_TUBMM|nr:uncharacterized protein GSTUM_00004966001 [Tuber melanosporum]CAZ81028.1 unnamed protein product [Tuber melanosporum]